MAYRPNSQKFVIDVSTSRYIRKHNSSKFDLESEGQGQRVEERDLRHSAGNVRIHIGEFSEFYQLDNIRLCKRIYTQTARDKGDDYIYASIEWSNGCRYMGIFVTSGATFKCKFDAAKAKFYRSFNAIMGRAGSSASLEILLSLMRSKCVPALLYGIEACPVNTKETRSLEYPITCAFFKILKTSSSDLVNECRLAFGFRQFSNVIADRKKFFNLKYISSNNTVCKAFCAWTLN